MSVNTDVLRVLTFNIHKGVSFYSGKQIIDRIKVFIHETKAHLVFLQEVRGPGQSGLKDANETVVYNSQFEYLADTVWDYFVYGKNAIYQKGNHGNAILSAYPVQSWSNSDISTNSLEKRGLLHVSVLHPKIGILNLICLHLNLMPWGRKYQINQLIEKISEELSVNPLIVAGDFNDWCQAVNEKKFQTINLKDAFLTTNGKYVRSYPRIFPILCLDRIYYRGLNPVNVNVLNGNRMNKLSDHAALIVDFSI